MHAICFMFSRPSYMLICTGMDKGSMNVVSKARTCCLIYSVGSRLNTGLLKTSPKTEVLICEIITC